jgi:hypothetical protein
MSGPPDESPWLIDFFEEGETHENVAGEEPEAAAGGGGGPRRARPRGPSSEGRARARLLALAVAGFLAVVVVVIIALGGGNDAGADTAYLAKLTTPAQDSQSVGAALGRLLTSTPSSLSGLETSLRQLLSRQRQDLNQTVALSPPPRLRREQQEAVSAMQFRVGGLLGILSGLRDASAHPTEANWPAELSLQADGLIASDVIWRDFFVTPTEAQLTSDGDKSASVPASTFVANANLTAPSSMSAVLTAVQTAPTTSTSQTPVLQLGDQGAAVTAWQKQLNTWIARQAGLTKLTLTGKFDAATRTATMELQTAAGITADGVVGPMTRTALASALAPRG